MKLATALRLGRGRTCRRLGPNVAAGLVLSGAPAPKLELWLVLSRRDLIAYIGGMY